jgi:hypothetical protein
MSAWHLGHFRAGAAAGGATGAGGVMEAPQFGQNFVPIGATVPHFGHGGPLGAAPAALPQFGQKRTPEGIIVPHFEHGVPPPP